MNFLLLAAPSDLVHPEVVMMCLCMPQDDEEWMEFVEEGGAHQGLLQEQEGCLYCDPPRPSQPSLLSCGGLMAAQHQNGNVTSNSSSLFNCRELMGMLHIPQLTSSPQG